jgi:hypothetical protein
MSLNPAYIHKRLAELRDLDPELTLFGAKAHRYQLQPTISAADVADYEQQKSISIPEEYRQFIIEVGNGGAGPFLGISGIPTEWDLDDLAAPFIYTKRTLDRSNSCVLQQIDALDESDANFDEEYDRLTLQYWTETNANGALHICEYGCALRFFLALNGVERGNIWFNATADLNGFFPVYLAMASNPSTEWCHHDRDTIERVGFARWYEAWLDRSIQIRLAAQ